MHINFIEGTPLHKIMEPSRLGIENYAPTASQTLYAKAKAIASGFADAFSPTMFTQVGERLSSVFSSATPKDKPVFLDNKVRIWLSDNNYIKLSVVQVYRPVGLKCTFNEYLDTLATAYECIANIDNDMLKPLESTVMTYLNNPSMLSASSIAKAKHKIDAQKLEKMGELVGACFDPTDKSDKCSWDHAVARNSDYELADEQCGKLVAAINTLGMKAIQDRVSRIFSLIDQLARNVETNPAFAAMTKPFAERLAAEVTACALAVEFLAVVVYQVHNMRTAIDDTNKHLKKLAGKHF